MEKTYAIEKYTAPRFTLRSSALRVTAPLVLLVATLASAQSTGGASVGSQLAGTAASDMGAIVATVIAILIVGIGVKVLWFANRQVKTGVSSAK